MKLISSQTSVRGGAVCIAALLLSSFLSIGSLVANADPVPVTSQAPTPASAPPAPPQPLRIFPAVEPEGPPVPPPLLRRPPIPAGSGVRPLPVPPHVSAARNPSGNALAWDATTKEVTAEPGQTHVGFTFSVTNVSSADVSIKAVRTSCGCTVPKLPPLPWVLAPQANGSFDVTVDVRGKRGTFTKVVSVDTSDGLKLLNVRVNVPELEDRRAQNIAMAAADRQAIFKGECASCHVAPAVGKKGAALYAAACGICHDAEHRASMVPDLYALNKPTGPAYWEAWISKGKAGSLMPAFAQSEGGPLTADQIESLVQYLTHDFKRPEAASAVGSGASE